MPSVNMIGIVLTVHSSSSYLIIGITQDDMSISNLRHKTLRHAHGLI